MSNLVKHLSAMLHSPIRNYAGVPGLTSYMVGGKSDVGIVRLMHSEREHQEPIIPHSHRFDFHCQVLEGRVRNVIWTANDDGEGDPYVMSQLTYGGKPGEYTCQREDMPRCWLPWTKVYHPGDEYSMRAEEVHSIFFDRNTSVLFFEGPSITTQSVIIEPWSNGEVVPTFKVEPWMFKRDPA